jgi:hypothetical protein
MVNVYSYIGEFKHKNENSYTHDKLWIQEHQIILKHILVAISIAYFSLKFDLNILF